MAALSEPNDEPSGLAMRLPYDLGRYTLHRELGAGGMATVYMGRMRLAEGVDRLVAVKTIHSHLARAQTFVDMFLDEAKIASIISHPNVCAVYDFGNVGGTYYLALEYLMGEPLADFINRVVDTRDPELMQALPYLAARIMADACEGLHAAHETRGNDGQRLDVVHRDVSPQNLFITYDGAVKVVDFGCAKAVQRVTQTDTGIMKGKVSYAAPEQLKVAALDARADVWALGVCLWETLTLRQLFARETAIQTAMAVLESPIPRADEVCDWVPSEIADIAAKALERDPATRYASARDMGRDLRRFIARSGTSFESAELADWMGYLFEQRKVEVRAMVAAVEGVEVSGRISRAAAVKAAEMRADGIGIGNEATKVARVQSSPSTAAQAERSATTSEPPADIGRDPTKRALRLDHEEEPVELPTKKRGWLFGLIIIALLAGGTYGGWMAWMNRVAWFGAGTVAQPPPPPEPLPIEEPVVEEPVVEPAPIPPTGEVSLQPTIEPVPTPVAPTNPVVPAPTGTVPPGTGRRPTAPTTLLPTPTPTPTPTNPNRPTTNLDTSQGTVAIAADNGWANVYLGDRLLGRTPLRVELPVGEHRLRILPYGSEPAQIAVIPVEWGTVNRLTVRLAPQEPTPEPDPPREEESPPSDPGPSDSLPLE